MMILYLILLLAVVLWKGYYALGRAMKTWRKDREMHDSLREYLLANGATERQAMWPFWRHALQRAFLPLLSQWRLWLIMLLLGLLALWLD